MQRRLPALSAARLAATNKRQRHGLRWPDCTMREVRQHVPNPAPLRIDFCIVLTFFKIDWSNAPVSLAAWTAQLSTQASGHPLPVSGYAWGRSVCRVGQSAPASLVSFLLTRDKGGARCSPRDVDAGSSRRSKVVASASVHQSRERRLGRGTIKTFPQK